MAAASVIPWKPGGAIERRRGQIPGTRWTKASWPVGDDSSTRRAAGPQERLGCQSAPESRFLPASGTVLTSRAQVLHRRDERFTSLERARARRYGCVKMAELTPRPALRTEAR